VAEVRVSSGNPHIDLFARLCDVDRRGRSVNITDRIIRVPVGGDAPVVPRAVRITLDDTAHRFLAGHRIRLQVSAGAHPRYARNLGTGEPDGTGTTMTPATIGIHHSPERASAFTLPVGRS
jgi:predicted acyl esterase